MPSAVTVEQPEKRVIGAGQQESNWGECEHGNLAVFELGFKG